MKNNKETWSFEEFIKEYYDVHVFDDILSCHFPLVFDHEEDMVDNIVEVNDLDSHEENIYDSNEKFIEQLISSPYEENNEETIAYKRKEVLDEESIQYPIPPFHK